MKKTTIILLGVFIGISCNDKGNRTETSDSTNIIQQDNPGNGDTTSYNRMNDKIPDTSQNKNNE